MHCQKRSGLFSSLVIFVGSFFSSFVRSIF